MQKLLFAAIGVASALGAFVEHAQAEGLSSCGNIHVEAQAKCEVKGGVSCEAECTPFSVQAACAAELAAECQGQCNVSAKIDCQTECQASCTANTCKIDPGKFDCRASCQASCDGSCSAHCEASNNKSECEASCKGNCSVTCDGKCDVELPELDCNTKCQASCDGSCEAEANADCQIDCQGKLYAECKVEVKGGCEADCMTEEGALFCDGEYVDHGDNLNECVTAIEAYIDANVEGYAEGSSSCSDNSCEAEGEAGVSCSAGPASSSKHGVWSLLALGAVWAGRRRRTR